MNNSRLLGAVCACFLAPLTTISHAAFIDDFETGTLDKWTLGGRLQWSWTANVVNRHGSQMGHLAKDGFTEVGLSNLFDYSSVQSFRFDMEVRSYGGGGGLGDAFYGYGGAQFNFIDSGGNQLGRVFYADASTNFLSDLASTDNSFAYNAVTPNVLLSYSLTMDDLTSQLAIPLEDIASVRLIYRAYASGLSSGMGGEVWFDNVEVVPVPAAAWLFGSGLLGLVGIARRKKAA